MGDIQTKLIPDVTSCISSFLLETPISNAYSKADLYSNYRAFTIEKNAKKTDYDKLIKKNPADAFMMLIKKISADLSALDSKLDSLLQLQQSSSYPRSDDETYILPQEIDMLTLNISYLSSLLDVCKNELNTKILETVSNDSNGAKKSQIRATIHRLSLSFDKITKQSSDIGAEVGKAHYLGAYNVPQLFNMTAEMHDLGSRVKMETEYLSHRFIGLKNYYYEWNEQNLKAAAKPVYKFAL